MDDQTALLREEFSRLLQKAAELKVKLDRMEGVVRGLSHYSVIEGAAHELGREVSRRVQSLHMAGLIAEHPVFARCPQCERRCELQLKRRTVLSGDGPVDLQEVVGHCPCCRRDFFPDAGNAGL